MLKRGAVIERFTFQLLSTAKGGAGAASAPRPSITLRVRDVQSKAGPRRAPHYEFGGRSSNLFGRANMIKGLCQFRRRKRHHYTHWGARLGAHNEWLAPAPPMTSDPRSEFGCNFALAAPAPSPHLSGILAERLLAFVPHLDKVFFSIPAGQTALCFKRVECRLHCLSLGRAKRVFVVGGESQLT